MGIAKTRDKGMDSAQSSKLGEPLPISSTEIVLSKSDIQRSSNKKRTGQFVRLLP